ncbi:serine-rich adhesin for platelets-like isoform X2 [Haliotis asinina]|uniref:serine-rich adhesin for platelets-like isoform X2 n=1 Tax=Haliotis asinina TaxID=109174 RepID=UPI0035321A3D
MASSSQYADAYKLKPDVLDKRKARLQRRSVEWKNLRFEEVGKRRKIDLDNLSPLQEQDQNITNVSKSYENKTPVKPTNEKKSKADLLKQRLIQWKLEKEQKKKLEAQEKAKRKQFKVSCNIQRTDKNLFRKEKTTSKTTNIKSKDTSTSGKSKSSSITNSRTEAPVSAPPTKQEAAPTTRRSTRSNDVTNKSKTVATKHTKPKPAQPAPAPLVRTTRQTRSSAKLKGSPKASTLNRPTFASSQKKATSDAPPTRTTRGKKLSPQFNIDLAKVSTDRGESFAPTDFAFEAPENVKSFTFKPLSPASAISFLDPHRDLTSTSFFLEPPSGRCSTPKSSKEEEGASSQDADEGETQQKTLGVHSSSSASESDEGSTTTVMRTPRRQTRSRSSKSSNADSDSDGKQDVTAVQMTPVAERTGQEKPVQMEVTETSSAAAPPKTPRRSRRSSVKGDVTQVDAKHTSGTTADEVASPRKSRRMSVQKQDNDDAEADTKVTEDENQMPHKATRRRSVRSVSDSDSAVESVDAVEKTGTPQKTKTPRGSRRSRRNSSETSLMEKIPEQGSSMDVIKEEQVTDSDDVFTVTVTDATESAPDSTNQEQSTSDPQPPKDHQEVSTTSKSTPVRTRRCSLSDVQCFREPGLPMSAQKSGRKRRRTEASDTPSEARSPEEWVKILSTSPMIEMRRRTPKAPRLSEDTLSQPLNFDDVLDVPPMENGPSTSVMETDEPASSGTDSHTGTAKESETEGPALEKTGTSEESKSQATAAGASAGVDHDVLYFRNLLTSETARLNEYITLWNKTKEEEATNISEEVEGQIRTTVGQAQLLIDQRFKQFRGLVDNCEFKTGEKETTCTDLQGFWDMIYFQVEDVDKKFDDLKTLQANNWQEVKKAVPVKKVVKKKTSAPLKPKAGGPSKFAAFRAQMKKQKEEEAKSSAAAAASPAESVKVIDFGFFTVTSPVKSPAKHCEAGSPAKEKTQEESATKPTSSDVAATLITKTPRRKSYVPAVPSPLLCDITPKPKPKPRRSLVTPLKKEDPSVPLSPMGVFTPPHAASPVRADSNATPKRRSIRLRKSLSLTPVSDQPTIAEETPGLDPRFLQPSGQPEADPHNTSDLARFLEQTTTPPKGDTDSHDSSFSKFFQPSTRSTQREGKRSVLKKLPSTQRRRSRRSVQFAMSPGSSPVSNTKLPSTPYNRDTLVPRSRLSHGEYLFTPPKEETEPSAGSTPTQQGRPRPSLLFTPAPQDSVAVSADNLMVFTP